MDGCSGVGGAAFFAPSLPVGLNQTQKCVGGRRPGEVGGGGGGGNLRSLAVFLCGNLVDQTRACREKKKEAEPEIYRLIRRAGKLTLLCVNVCVMSAFVCLCVCVSLRNPTQHLYPTVGSNIPNPERRGPGGVHHEDDNK